MTAGEIVDPQDRDNQDDRDCADRVYIRSPHRLTVTFGAGALVKDDAQTRQHREHDRGGSIMNVGNDVWRLITATGEKGYPEPGHRGDLAQYHFSGAVSVVGKQERTDCEQEPDKEIAGPTALVIRGADRSNRASGQPRSQVSQTQRDQANR